MTFVVDTSSFRELERYYIDIFPTFWELFQSEVNSGGVVSVREVWRELEACPETNVIAWAKNNSGIFKPPTAGGSDFRRADFRRTSFRPNDISESANDRSTRSRPVSYLLPLHNPAAVQW
jgi:hypothetical protein